MNRMVNDGKVLIATAREALRAPLRFGDDSQIKALKFLERAQEHYEHLASCPRCQQWEECPYMGVPYEVADAAWALLQGEGISALQSGGSR